ncbi:3'(2'),5'-bisphosphate nucleotidase CysQ family protein [Gelidibacter japonicus]|uniref:3'(2'),5'-bisphosphate nucleotidase CysQ family protein n=1 Tax=Gelidibacter japonicus TaxID=1962232 RepID=UPI0013D10284|nr:3'(2'),5'-bisphosphate nucleotidase CysQ [Gelidibacter japonicus]
MPNTSLPVRKNLAKTGHLKTAITAALEAGKVILDIYHSDDFEVELKSDHSPLTKADVAAHHVILSHLKPTNIPVLSEEGKSIPYGVRKEWKQLWMLDPIDGTKEFIKRNGEFTVNIALIENRKPVLGIIFVPVTGDLYFSWTPLRQEIEIELARPSDVQAIPGAYKVNVNLTNYNLDDVIAEAVKLPLPRTNNIFTILASRSHPSEATETYIHQLKQKYGEVEVVTKGSSLKFCLIAEGQADCYPKFGPTMEWDTAAGQAICEQAGIEVLDWISKENMIYNREDLLNPWFIVQKQMPI